MIEPVRPASYDLTSLIDGITVENRHDPVAAEAAVVREAW